MSTSQYKDQRVGIFIDIQNLYHSAKHLYGGRVNYKELIKNLVFGRRLVRAIAYVVKSEGIENIMAPPERTSPHEETGANSGREATFFEALENAGIDLRIKDIQIFPGGTKKADWDVGMAVDAIRIAPMLDVVILVTGDGDFVPLVEYLKWGLGKQVEVAAFGKSSSAKLKEVADQFITIEKIPKSIIKK
ncbi:MAG: NYN domain-containing protein [bacterium]|nr:NYN domain-containing protein [bacterium]